jgi:hypothetical protein
MSTTMPPPPPATHRARRISIEVLVVLAVAGLIAVILTWPLAANFDTIIAGGGSAGDNTGYIWDLWSNSHYGIDLWGAGLQDHVGLPFGRTVIGGGNLLLFFYNVPGAILGTFLPTIAAYNVMVLAGLALTGASMYLLVRWLGLGIGPAAWAGMAFEIFPYEALRTAAHPPLAWLMFAPLLLMACIWWLQKPSWRRATVMAAATLFAWLSDPYFGAMALVAVGVTLLVAIPLFAHCFGGRAVLARVGEAIGALVVIVIVPLVVIIASTRGVADQIVTRQRVELELYGAHIGDYLKPVSGQYLWTGIFGTDAAQWPLSSPGGERMAFLGWTVMALAIIGLALGWRHRGNIGLRLRAALFLTIPIAIAMGIFSLASPYSIFGHRIPMASSFIFDFLPFLRVYARFSLFVMACVLVMGAVGLALLMRGRSITWRTSIMGIAIILTAMELPISVPIGTGVPILLNGTTPENVPTWRWLANHDPGAVVFETPAFPNETMDREFLYGQLVHGHPLANGGLTEPGAVSDFGREYGNPLFPASPATYAAAGIRYVVINPWAWQQAGLTTPDVATPPAGYSVAATFPDGSGIWRVTAAPDVAFAFPAAGWTNPQTIRGVRWRYMGGAATYTAWAPRAAIVTIRFRAAGFVARSTYKLAVTAPDGTTSSFPVVGRSSITLRTALPQGTSTFHLVASGAQAMPLSTADTTPVAVRVSQWVIS